jgi:hypothetical protein
MVTTTSAEGTKSPHGWVDLINESVHTNDDIDIGGIDAVSRFYCSKARSCKYSERLLC